MHKLLIVGLIISTLTGCAIPQIAPDMLAKVKHVEQPYVNNASNVLVSIDPKINNYEKIDNKVKDSIELALKNSNLFGDNVNSTYKIRANVLVASQAAVSFGNFNGKLSIEYTVIDPQGKTILQTTIATIAGSDLNPLAPGVARHTRARARNIALNVNQFVEKLEENLKAK